MSATATTPMAYEVVCARYNAISENTARMRVLLRSLGDAVEQEYRSAQEQLRAHETSPGIALPFLEVNYEVGAEDMDFFAKEAVTRLAGLFPWASNVIG